MAAFRLPTATASDRDRWRVTALYPSLSLLLFPEPTLQLVAARRVEKVVLVCRTGDDGDWKWGCHELQYDFATGLLSEKLTS